MTSNWWDRSTPEAALVLPVPWLNSEAVVRLEKLVQPDWNVIEHGAGGSTLWLAQRCAQVMSVENDPDWQSALRAVMPQNVILLSRWHSGFTFNAADLLLVDGDPVEDRSWWIENARSLLKPSGWVVLDNANRPEYAGARKELLNYCNGCERYNGNGMATKYLVTEFYHLPA